LPKNILLEHFYLGLNKEAALHLDIASGGSFSHETINEGKAILEKILENTSYTGIFDEFPEEEKEIELSPELKVSAFSPAGVLSQRVNQMLRVPNLDGDARRIHGGLSWFGQRKALRPAGRGSIVFPCT
jgi:hypothetical protein